MGHCVDTVLPRAGARHSKSVGRSDGHAKVRAERPKPYSRKRIVSACELTRLDCATPAVPPSGFASVHLRALKDSTILQDREG